MSMRGRSSLYIIVHRFVESLKPKNLTRKPKYVGNDYLGNSYYEIEADPSRGKRTPVRSFKPRTEEQWDQPLPPEWNAWLRLRRVEPPTNEEIEYNLAIEAMKKRNDIKTESIEPRKHSFSTFPTYKEYEEEPGFRSSERSK